MTSRFDADTLAKAIEFVAKGGVLPPVAPVAPAAPAAPAPAPAVAASAPQTKAPEASPSSGDICPIQVSMRLCRCFEGLYLSPYLCPAGIPTIGYGATYYQDGTPVMLSDPPITRAQAESLLTWMIKTVYMPAVTKLCPNITDAGVMAAMIDFVYNLGAGQLRASTLRKRINSSELLAAKRELMKWVRGGGRVLPGLQRRRIAESSLF